MPAAIKSVTAQAFHYFSRSNAGGVRREPIADPCAWVGAELMRAPERYTVALAPEQVAELRAVVAQVAASGTPMLQLGPEDFPLPRLAPVLARARRELQKGLGFVLLKGVPVDHWQAAESELFFWGLGLHLGTCGAQDTSGELLGHVTDTGADPRVERQYKTRAAIDYHCDACDCVGLLCLSAGTRGGESRLVSSAEAYNRFLAARPDLAGRLYEPFLLDTRGSGGVQGVPIEPVRHGADGRLRAFWHHEYFVSAFGKPGMPVEMPAALREVHEAMGAIIHDDAMAVKMQLEAGDVQLVSNDTILHARAAYEDSAESKRHLLRLWISFDDPLGASDWFSKKWHFLVMLSRFAKAKMGLSANL